MDTFTRYFEPENAHAAVRVLGAAGYRTVTPRAADGGRPLCCGRTFLSVGLVDGEPLLDLCYEEDVRADADFTVAMTDKGELVEIQGAGEGGPFSKETVPRLITLASEGLERLFQAQRDAIQSLKGG